MPTFNPRTILFTVESNFSESVAVLVREPGGPTIVGGAVPSVAAPMSTTEVTLTLPDNQPWEIVVNPVDPVDGGLFGSSEVGSCRSRLGLVVHVQADGATSWTGPDPVC